jgi:chondroitin sulfate synthase
MNLLKIDTLPASGKTLDLGMSQCSDDSLLFFIDVDILFDNDTLSRIRRNTIKNVQVYYPIVFSQYDPTLICSNSLSCDIKWTNFSSDLGYLHIKHNLYQKNTCITI